MNKKVLMTVVLAGATSLVMAQKPTEGNPHSLELGMNLFNVNSNVNRDSTAENRGVISAPQLRYRYFLSSNLAIRFGLGFDGSKKETNFSEDLDGSGSVGTLIEKSSRWEVAPGIEYHFAGTDRLSPYVGLAISIGGGKDTETCTECNGSAYREDYSKEKVTPFSSFGVGLLAGADFYFAENFFVGAEFGYLINSETEKDSEIVTNNDGDSDTTIELGSKSSSNGFGATAAIRLGWRF
jgi:opacity protein-like surface antigen